ncbi:hypothetical protein HanRHA438_Chr06g0282411 [Helianthus annuus]|nr:hypothetical protein HanRHA438_Chr06g0282411 [Helianthus annuus]
MVNQLKLLYQPLTPYLVSLVTFGGDSENPAKLKCRFSVWSYNNIYMHIYKTTSYCENSKTN